MCGIGGAVRMGKRPFRKWQLQQMAVELQHRGHDATGFALMDVDGLIHTYKVAHPAWKACSSPDFHNWADKALTDRTRIFLVHTRAYTKGSPHMNENNHPLYSEPGKDGLIDGVIVHNGMVRNDDALFDINKKLYGFKRSCITDSDIFRAVLDNHGCVDKALIKNMRIIEGTAAVAAFHRNSPGKLLLLRDSNPLVLGATSDTLAFASTKEALHKILKPWIKVHNLPMQVHMPDLSFIAMRNETGYIIGPKGIEEHDEFKCNGRGTGGYVKYGRNAFYFEKQARAAADATREKNALALRVSAESETPVAQGRVTALSSESEEAINGDDLEPSKVSGFDDPSRFQFTICPNITCNMHVELSVHDQKLSSLSLLACKSCGTNLANAPDADLRVN